MNQIITVNNYYKRSANSPNIHSVKFRNNGRTKNKKNKNASFNEWT